jgi:phosphatidyl-myo-inositol dimannoside synthase
MRILVFSVDHLPSVGGSYRVMHELLKRHHGSSTTLITNMHDDSDKFDKNQNYKIIRHRWFNYFNRDNPKWIKFVIFPIIILHVMLKASRRGSYDVIVWGQSVGAYGFVAHILKKITKVPYAIFVMGEGITSLAFKQGKKYIPTKYMFRHGLNSADLIIANSQATKDRILSLNIRESLIAIIYPGVDGARFHPKSNSEVFKKKHNIQGKNILLSLGRLIERKGFDKVIEALPKILHHYPDTVYVIKGEGNYKDELLRLVEINDVSSNVLFIDDVPYDTLPSIYNAADIFLTPNRLTEISKEQEGFGIVFLEANCCGLPVIGGRSGGAVEAIEDNVTGFLVDGTKVQEIASKTMFLLSNKAKAKAMGVAGRERALKEFSYDTIVKKYIMRLHAISNDSNKYVNIDVYNL